MASDDEEVYEGLSGTDDEEVYAGLSAYGTAAQASSDYLQAGCVAAGTGLALLARTEDAHIAGVFSIGGCILFPGGEGACAPCQRLLVWRHFLGETCQVT